MEKLRELKKLKKYFWDYDFEKIDTRMFSQRIIDYWPMVVSDLENNLISKDEFKETLFIIQKNFNSLHFKYPIIKRIIEEILKRREKDGS